jgi:2-keto-4-pentenoate hydratase/2-oxohepta-3-ene-1,7-dioic acid hydratase in catechol pathway
VKDRLASGDRIAGRRPTTALDDVELLAPHVPRAIFGIGLNYLAHAAERTPSRPSADRLHEAADRPSRARRAGARPRSCSRLDYEGELAVVMGAAARSRATRSPTTLTARDLQRREPQWTRAKGFDRSCPSGPWITTADEVADPDDLRCARGSTASCARTRTRAT